MYTTTLRVVGGSVMFAIPKAVLDGLGMRPNQSVGMSMTGGKLVIEPQVRPRFTLDALLAECDFGKPPTDDDRQWLDSSPAGNEVL